MCMEFNPYFGCGHTSFWSRQLGAGNWRTRFKVILSYTVCDQFGLHEKIVQGSDSLTYKIG